VLHLRHKHERETQRRLRPTLCGRRCRNRFAPSRKSESGNDHEDQAEHFDSSQPILCARSLPHTRDVQTSQCHDNYRCINGR
jgi:hypothetical protein